MLGVFTSSVKAAGPAPDAARREDNAETGPKGPFNERHRRAMGIREIIEDVFERNEKQLTQFAADLLSNPRFADAVVRAFEMSTEARNRFDENVQPALQALGLPQREDFEALADRVKTLSKSLSEIDNRLSRLTRQVDQSASAAAGAKKDAAEIEALRDELAKKDAALEAAEEKLKKSRAEVSKLKKNLKQVEAGQGPSEPAEGPAEG